MQRGYFLAVLAPRPTSDPPTPPVTPVRGPNTLGLRLERGNVEDLILFAQDAPQMNAGGVSAIGRSCLVRRVAGRLSALTLHNGQRLAVSDVLVFETNGSGHIALTIRESEVHASCDIYDNTYFRLHAPAKPEKVLADGKEIAFEFDPATRTIRFDCRRTREVRAIL